ncbi:hypothetical protein P280DRAFT_512360 [Massarina eburnea CBS 473.64]|uniref:Protein regulator of cytokinesis 1 n=1 Tax=Massarina eburnea CBS 473.64 TaxID=1395130 RepID=A0A6A6SGK7_9PLEO|nr:hypothetical protein P280DRAFT_512360 [Massarina eburnea CBS 473.64]
MDTSYLAQQVTTIIGQLHGLFDEIGVPGHERDAREEELFSALSETLNNQLKLVTTEKHDLAEEAERLAKAIRQMEVSLVDNKPDPDEDDVEISFPLTRCIKDLKAKHSQISKLHRERWEEVKKLVEAFESYASHLEPDFIQIKLPSTSTSNVPPNFDMSPSYVASLDQEFTRVYEEYQRRINSVQVLSKEIVQLWAELGTPQAQTDSAIVQHYRDAPEQLGLHKEDIAQLKTRRERLMEEKRARERRLGQLRTTIEDLWERLNVEQSERKKFLASNRGCGLRTINEFEDELSRLNELKRQNLHLFVEEARVQLQELWDALYFSEEEMLDFAPAFSDVCSDALLSAHEAEIARLEALKEQRLPILSKIDRHRELVNERDDLQQSSQDASRLMGRGNKGERRDPGKLLREEKMRKRIAKELPKVEAELKKTLEKWEDEYGRPFLVLGDRYLDDLYACESKAPHPPPRSKTPSSMSAPLKQPKSAPLMRASTVRGPPPTRSKTPVSNFGTSLSRHNPFSQSMSAASNSKSPTKIPARGPLKNMPHGGNSPERRATTLQRENSTIRKMPPPMAPPPRMKDLFIPPPEVEGTPLNRYNFNRGDRSESIVRQVPPEDPYDDRSYMSRTMRAAYTPSYTPSYTPTYAPPPQLGGRQISNTSSTSTAMTVQSGSENWETYSDHSDEAPEHDADLHYYRQQAARSKRFTPEGGHGGSPRTEHHEKKQRSVRSVEEEDDDYLVEDGDHVVRVVGGSDAGWTDDGDY